MHRLLFLLLLAGALHSASAGPVETPRDKRGYDLFHPVPRALLRELNTDRPDKTESPYTVDAGHVQIEMDAATFNSDRHNSDRTDTRVERWSFGVTNFKVGLLDSLDVQFIIAPYTVERTAERPTTTRRSGFGDFTVRAKLNLRGNDGGAAAFALMPFVKFPTNEDGLGNHAVEGGLILPLAVKLPGDWDVGLMTEVDILEDNDGRGRHAEWVDSITCSHALVGRLSGYAEFFSAVSAESRQPWVGTIDFGLVWELSADVHLDCGVNIGLTRAADDVNPFVGVSWRF